MQQAHSNTAVGQGSPLALLPSRTPQILPGDRVYIFDALYGHIWINVEDVLIGERTKIRAAGMDFYFDESLVLRHRKGGRK